MWEEHAVTRLITAFYILVAYPASQVFYRWHDPTLAVGYEGKLQLPQFDIMNTKYRQLNFSRSDAKGEH